MENEGDVPEAEATAARAARATVTRIVAVGMWKKE
jgi:hypothetical protein